VADALDEELKAETEVAKNIKGAQADGATVLGNLPPNPPIDSIAHSVSFAITLSATATPSWTLVHFKGPGTGNSLVGASRAFTNTLNISMGPTSDTTKVSMETLRQLDNLRQESAFRSALRAQ
jgi:hypothetical protein